MKACSTFRKLPSEITDMIYHLVGEGHIATISRHSDPERRIVLPAPVYDSLVSLDAYLWDEQVHCTLSSTERYGALRRYRRAGRGIFDDFPVLDVLPPTDGEPFTCHVPFEVSYDDSFIGRVSRCIRVLAMLPHLGIIYSPTKPFAYLSTSELFDILKVHYTVYDDCNCNCN